MKCLNQLFHGVRVITQLFINYLFATLCNCSLNFVFFGVGLNFTLPDLYRSIGHLPQ